MNQMNGKRKYLTLLCLFIFSVLLRVPTLNRPVSKHHEFNVAFFLIPMEIWEHDGILQHHFLPAYNYSNVHDKFVYSLISVEEGIKNGTEYYLSFPAFSYILPYFFMKAFFLKISVLNLQLFNLIIHLFICLLLFKLLSAFFETFPSLIGTSLYMFAPGPLWFHGNAYSFHSLAVFAYLLTAFLLFKYLQSKKNEKRYLWFYGFSLFFFLYTEWIAVLFLFFLIPSFYLIHKKEDKIKPVLLVSIISLVLFILVISIQTTSFLGFDKYVNYLLNRFSYRSTFVNQEVTLAKQMGSIAQHFITSYGIWLLLIISLSLIGFRKIKQVKLLFRSSVYLTLVLVFLLSVLLYHILFMQFAVEHDYSVLMDGVLLSLCICYLCSKAGFLNRHYLILFALGLIGSAVQYYYINRPGKYSLKNDLYASYKNIGETIKATSKSDETIFISGFSSKMDPNNPQIVYYAKRNYLAIDRIEEADSSLRKLNRRNGRVYVLEGDKIKQMIPIRVIDRPPFILSD